MNIIRLSWSSYQTEQRLQEEAERIRSLGHRYLRPRESGPRPGKLTTYDAIIINSQFTVTESFLDQWNREGLILTASSGYNHIDVDACHDAGVTVGRTPLSRAGNVCDYVRSSLHLLKRDFHRTGHPNQEAFWDRSGAFTNVEAFDELTVGIIGFGVIGERLVDRLGDFPVERILACDPLREDTIGARGGVELTKLNPLLEESDLVTIHADLNPSTHGLIDAGRLDRMSSSAVLINSARGAMVDLGALLESLENDDIGGAILDVLPEEPPTDTAELRRPGLMVTPHSAGFGPGLTDRLTEEITRNLQTYDETGEPVHPVTPRARDERDRLETQRDGRD